jgi:hypothetical protein
MAKKLADAPAEAPVLAPGQPVEVLLLDSLDQAVVARAGTVVAIDGDLATVNVHMLPSDGRLCAGTGKGVLGAPVPAVLTLSGLAVGNDVGCVRVTA